MQRKRRRPKNPTRKLSTVARDVDRTFPDWEASIVEGYAPTGSERVLLFRVRDRLSGSTVFQTTSATERSVSAERWFQRAKRQLAAR